MTDRKWFKPAEGLSIVDPNTRRIVPPQGQWVRATDEYFINRARDLDGELTDHAPPGAGEA
jgi:hypothetical protein